MQDSTQEMVILDHKKRERRCTVVIMLCAVLLVLDIFGASVLISRNASASERAISQAQTAPKSVSAGEVKQDAEKDVKQDHTSEQSAEASRKTREEALPTNPIAASYNGISGLGANAGIATSGFQLSEASRARLQQQLDAFAAAGAQVSFTLVDLKTGRALGANENLEIYSASTVKGPYVLSLAGEGKLDLASVSATSGGYLNRLITQTITISDNDSYEKLFNTYGAAPFSSFFAETGSRPERNQYGYFYLSSADLARMWVKGYQYLFMPDKNTQQLEVEVNDPQGSTGGVTVQTDSGAAGQNAPKASVESRKWLASLFTDTLNSNIHATIGDHAVTLTKAGWINGEGNLYALNDAGIVLPDGNVDIDGQPNAYAISIMSTACGRSDLMKSLASTIDQIYQSEVKSK